MYNLMARHEVSKAKTQISNKIRNSVQKQAMKLTREVSVALSKGENTNKDELLVMLGKVISYLEVRKDLMTDIGNDGYINSLKGAKNKLEERIKSFS